MDDLSCYDIVFLRACNKHLQLTKHQAIDYVWNLLEYDGSWDAFLTF